jgi:hypothetical protein
MVEIVPVVPKTLVAGRLTITAAKQHLCGVEYLLEVVLDQARVTGPSGQKVVQEHEYLVLTNTEHWAPVPCKLAFVEGCLACPASMPDEGCVGKLSYEL